MRNHGTRVAVVVTMLLGVFLAATPASATTISKTFSFFDSAVSPPDAAYVTGSFSYDDSLSGVLSFADLSTFSITMQHRNDAGTTTYNLAFVQLPQTYSYFGYNATTNTWVPTAVSYSGTPWSSILVAANGPLNNGFWFDALTSMDDPAGNGTNNGYYCDYSTSKCGAPGDHYVDGFTIENASAIQATPLPAALPLFATGLCGLGLFAWRRKRKAAELVA